jgi:hypothetical protein
VRVRIGVRPAGATDPFTIAPGAGALEIEGGDIDLLVAVTGDAPAHLRTLTLTRAEP